MATNLLAIEFERMGARLKIADRLPGRNRTAGVISLDVQTDRKEFFEITRQPYVEAVVPFCGRTQTSVYIPAGAAIDSWRTSNPDNLHADGFFWPVLLVGSALIRTGRSPCRSESFDVGSPLAQPFLISANWRSFSAMMP